MSTNSTNLPSVLIVDDEPDLADTYALHLRDRYTVKTVYHGRQALETVDSSIDVILLDRHMPGLSGGDVLNKIRANDYDCRVIMVTAVDPEFDIIEMPFDDYLCKPVDKKTLVNAIEQQLTAKKYDQTLRDLYQAKSKLSVLKADKTTQELEASTEYQQLKQRAAETQKEAELLISELDDFESMFNAIDRQ